MKLKIDLSFNTDQDSDPEFTAQPVYVPLSTQAAALVAQGIGLADLFDLEPGDGDLDVRVRGSIPFRVPILRRDVNLPLDARLEISVVEDQARA